MAEVAPDAYWTLASASAVPLSPPETVLGWGSTLVVAPHPDDESLGCGGAIALLRAAGLPATIALLTDGHRSHPGSREYPRERLVAVRRAELIEAAGTLGVARESLHFLELPDADVPASDSLSGRAAIATLRRLMAQVQTVLVTWRGDPHCDHRAAYEYVARAAQGLPVSLWEYPVWVWQNGRSEDAPSQNQFDFLRLDISPVLSAKERAVQAHQSQLGSLVTDDPDGFAIPPELLEHFRQPWELFIQRKPRDLQTGEQAGRAILREDAGDR